MKLYEPFPSSVVVDGKIYHLRPAFDRVLQAIDVMQGDGPQVRKIDAVCWLLIRERRVKNRPKVVNAALNALFPSGDSNTNKLFDWEQDASYIYAAFWQAYGIDLAARQDRGLFRRPLHWCAFLALFCALPQNTQIMNIMAVRARPIPKPTKYNRDEINTLLKQKSVYALKMTEEERQSNLQEGLKKMAACLLAMSKRGN